VTTIANSPPGTNKVRRRVHKCKPALGHQLQKAGRRIHRPSPSRFRVKADDQTATGVAGLAEFAQFARDCHVDKGLRDAFGSVKDHHLTVYPMDSVLRMLIDVNVAGEGRVFGLEALAADPLFIELAGGSVPSLDVVYDDLCRLDDDHIRHLETMMAAFGLAELQALRPTELDVDIDTTVEPLFGQQENALPGPNPRYHGRPSFHPILAFCPQVQSVVGALLRPGNTGFGREEIPTVIRWLQRVRQSVGPDCLVRVRIDSAAAFPDFLDALDREGVFFSIKARMDRKLVAKISACRRWTTVDVDDLGRPTLQYATVSRQGAYRVVAVRSSERYTGGQLALWDDLDLTVQAYVTNDRDNPGDVIQRHYDGRAEVEPIIGELKYGWAIGKVPSKVFSANHVLFLIKLMSFNLFRAFTRWSQNRVPPRWRTPWCRRALICRPGHITRGPGRTWVVHVNPPADARVPP